MIDISEDFSQKLPVHFLSLNGCTGISQIEIFDPTWTLPLYLSLPLPDDRSLVEEVEINFAELGNLVSRPVEPVVTLIGDRA